MSSSILLLLLAAASTTPSPLVQKRVEARTNGGLSVYNDGGAWGLQCLPASASDGGCLTAGTQTINGFKTFTIGISGPIVEGSTTVESALFQNGTTGNGTRFRSNRAFGSISPDHTFEVDNRRDAGSLIAIQNRTLDGTPLTVAQVDPDGQFIGGVGGVGSFASFQDGSGVSGHPSLTCSAGFYPVIYGRLGENHSVYDVGPVRPVADGGTWVQTESDGGTYYAYAGKHGDTTAASSQARYGGWLWQWDNPITNTAADARAYIDYNGGFGQAHQLSRAQFPAIAVPVTTTIGQFYYGQFTSTLMFDFVGNEWYFMGATTWERVTPLTLHSASRESLEHGHGNMTSGALAVSFTTAFGAAPDCTCTHVNTTNNNACVISVDATASAVTFAVASGGTDKVYWSCQGLK